MKLKSLISEDLSVLIDIKFSTELFNVYLNDMNDKIDIKYPYIVDFYNSYYKKKVRSVSNKSYIHHDIKTELYLFEFKGFDNKGYAIFQTTHEKTVKRFSINEDLSESFFYPLLNDIPEMRFHFFKDKYVISFIEIEDAYIAIDTTKQYMTIENNKTRQKKYKEAELTDIVIQLKQNNPYKYVKQIEFVNDKIKSFTTTKLFRNLFTIDPIVKFAFKRKETSKMKNIAIYLERDNEIVRLFGDKLNTLKAANEIGINILNPFLFNIDDIDLFELNFAY